MEQTARGDRNAFAVLIQRHQRLVLAIAYRYLGDRDEAQDTAQEVFLRLWDAARRYRPDRPLQAYLRTLTVNFCLDHRRKAKPLLLADPDRRPGGHDPHALVEEGERDAALLAALDSLAPAQRMALVLFHFEGLSVHETASLLGVSPKAAESLLSRARAALRSRLAGRR